jgi:hypothetical protein
MFFLPSVRFCVAASLQPLLLVSPEALSLYRPGIINSYLWRIVYRVGTAHLALSALAYSSGTCVDASADTAQLPG